MHSVPPGGRSRRPNGDCCWNQPGSQTVTTALGAKALDQQHIATAPIADVRGWLEPTAEGLSTAEAANRLARVGPNSVRTHRVSAVAVLRRQLNNAVLGLLAVTAVLSFFLG